MPWSWILRTGDRISRREVLARLVAMQYTRNDADFTRGVFRVRGETIDIFPAESPELALRLTLFDDEIESLELFDPDRAREAEAAALYGIPGLALRDAARNRAARDRDHQGRTARSGWPN